MKTSFRIFLIVSLLTLNSCGIVQLSFRPHDENNNVPKKTETSDTFPESTAAKNHIGEGESCDCDERSVPCEECAVVPRSGNMRDNRHGYYYDENEKKCKEVFYSSGGVGAPFNTMTECLKCCCKNHGF